MKIIASLVLAISAVALSACSSMGGAASPNQPPSAAKGVWFMEPADGAVVPQTFKVKFGVKGMAIDPAGEQKAGSGHHHLLINTASIASGNIIPIDEKHVHFGKGQTETEVKLPPGVYKLSMQFADGFHLSYGQEMAATINVTVK